MLVLGAVQEVRDFEISVSLPGNMCGAVTIGNVSDPLTQGVLEEIDETDDIVNEETKLKEVYDVS